MFISVLGNNIHYQIIEKQWIEEGRPLLVFLHEGLGSIPQWKDFPQKLSDKLQLPALIYERVGYGQSDYWKGPISRKFLHFEGLVMLPDLLKTLDINNKIIIFGHSDGGTIGLIQSSQPMPQLLGAIIEAPHIMFEQHSLDGIAKARTMLDQPKLIRIMDRYHSGRAAQLIDAWTSFWLNADPKEWEAGDEIKKIKKPLLLIQGDNDEFGTYNQIDKVTNEAQSKILEVAKLPECGHIPHLQQMDKVIELTEEFIQKL
jgi:pimeloyl-ACP methyl ester carboxylesterase